MDTTYKDKIEQADVVSFDIFDTVLIRKVARPTDVFRIVQEYFNAVSPHFITADFAKLRVDAEIEAYKTINPNADIDAIYGIIARRGNYNEAFIEALKRAELDVESILLEPNAAGVKLYKQAREAGKQVVFISDMYLKKSFVKQLLKKNGFDEWDELIVSAEDGVAKHDGTAYARLFTLFPDSNYLHVGDNEHSDIHWAQAYGIDTIHLEQNLKKMSYETQPVSQTAQGGMLYRSSLQSSYSIEDTQHSMITGIIAGKIAAGGLATHAESIGYSIFGPLLLGYVQWLHTQANTDGVDELYFLARDGAIMQRAYDEYWRERALPSHYLLASRRLYNLPKLTGAFAPEDITFLTSTDYPLLVSDYIGRLGLETNEPRVRTVLQQLGLEPETRIDTSLLQQRMKAAFMLLADVVRELAHKERTLLLDYFREEGLKQGMGRNKAIVDVGWNGSMQRSLNTLLKSEFTGYYFGIHDNEVTIPMGNAMGAFLDRRNDLTKEQAILTRGAVEVMEYFFTNPAQQSVVGLKKHGKEYVAVTAEEDRDETMLQNLREIQASAVDFISDFRKCTAQLPEAARKISLDVSIRNAVHMYYHPNDGAATVIGLVAHSHSIGVPARFIGSPIHDRGYYLKHRDALQKEYDIAYWKPGFIKNAAMKGIPFELS
ncbi:hypothetical protein JNJ66_07125 [Candidatus Saccharibacteria bacterium]|nr:hypothetical protein [Candidatus Saccharibacteria bacterium]